METVNSVVNSASKLIWGETDTTKQTTEPVSGQTGAGTANDPYDKGNTDSSITSDTTTTGTTAPTTGTTDTTSTSKDPSSTMTSTSTDPTSNTQSSTNDPATAAHSTSTEPGQKQQGADRPTESPSAAQTEAVKVTDDNREELAAKGKLPKIPDDHSGEPMQMHGGAAKETSAEDTADPRTEGKKDRSASVSHEGGGTHGKVEGSGEQWVKSSGLAAEGGDFDATKPGAGKEANRILEEKGIKKDDRGVMSTEDGSSPDLGTEGGETTAKKESKMAKLKEKLHIGHGKKSDA